MKAIKIFKKHGAHYYENDEEAVVAAMEECAVEFEKWVFNGGWHKVNKSGTKQFFTAKELFKIWQEEK